MAPNIVIQILIEKGIAGILLYLSLAVFIAICVWKRKKGRECADCGMCHFCVTAKRNDTGYISLLPP